MQLSQIQSDILVSVKKLRADQQKNVLQYIDELHQNDLRLKEKLKNQALKEIRQALRGGISA